MKKCIFVIVSVLLLGILFFSCSDGSSNSDNPTDLQSGGVKIVKSSKLKFDFSGAMAVAKLESDSSSSRAAASADDLGDIVKILADGSMETAITVASDTTLSNIVSIYKSPIATSTDVFIVFENSTTISSETDSVTGSITYTHIGQLICVHEDGSVVDILDVDPASSLTDSNGKYISIKTDSVQFDANGNMYFISNSWDSYNLKGEKSSGEVIYQFNPSTNEIIEMVASVADTYYNKVQIDNAGQWLFVSGSRASAGFLRAIPVNNPNRFVNVFYSSSYGSVFNWIYDDNAEVLYYTANDGNQSGLFSVC